MSSAKERDSLSNAAVYLRENVSTWLSGEHARKVLALADEIDPDVENAEVVSAPPEPAPEPDQP